MTSFQPKREDFAEAVHTLHDAVGLSTLLGIELTTVTPGEVTATLKLKPEITQQDGVAHAGTITALADTVCGLAAYSLMPAGVGILSVNLNVALMRPGAGEYLRATGRVTKAGRRIYFTEAEVYADDGSDEKLVAKVSATMTIVSKA